MTSGFEKDALGQQGNDGLNRDSLNRLRYIVECELAGITPQACMSPSVREKASSLIGEMESLLPTISGFEAAHKDFSNVVRELKGDLTLGAGTQNRNIEANRSAREVGIELGFDEGLDHGGHDR